MPSRPPSTTITEPLQYAPALEARNRIVPAMSGSEPARSAGIKDGSILFMNDPVRSVGNTVGRDELA